MPFDGLEAISEELFVRQKTRMTHKLFVYGTLLPQARDRMGRRPRACLSAAGVWCGAASLKGVIYDLGGYPGLLENANGDEGATVAGALIELADPLRVFAWLDRYEGIDPRRPGTADYRRVMREAEGRMGAVLAWVYLSPTIPAGAVPIAGGDWLDYVAAQACGKPFRQR